MVRQLTQGLGWGGVTLLAGLAVALTGCSTAGQTDSTAAIAGPGTPGMAEATSASGQQVAQAGADGTVMPGVGKAITLADASCDQIKAEVATFDSDKIPQKLADFGKAKYHPTAEESIRFARYVDVEKASKDKNCAPGKAMKKQVTAQKTTEPMVAKSKKKPAVVGKVMVPADPAAAAPAAKAAKVAAPAAPAAPTEDGVTITVPDSSG